MKLFLALFCIAVTIGFGNATVNTTMCNACLEDAGSDDDVAKCTQMQTTQNCSSPSTDNCFTAAGRYKYNNGSTAVHTGVARGCIDCSTTVKGCEEFTKYFNGLQNWTLLDCNIVCCKGDKCNNQTISVKPTVTVPPANMSTVTMTPTAPAATTAAHAIESRPVSVTAVLVIATIVGALFF